MAQEIYIKLKNEDIDVWRPVIAEEVSEGIYQLPVDVPVGEEWEFPSGSQVAVEERKQKGIEKKYAVRIA